MLGSHPKIRVIKISSLHETKAVTLDDKPQPDYLNGAIEIETSLSPIELLATLKGIEQSLGRKLPAEDCKSIAKGLRPPGRRPLAQGRKPWRPRPMDLDILMYGDLQLDTPELKIPHPRLHEREFVLKPLSEIAPKFDSSGSV